MDFQGGATFVEATFAHNLRIENARFNGLDSCKTKFTQLVSFTKVEFLNYALFGNAQFTGRDDGYAVKFEDSRFEGITDFSGAAFALGDQQSVGFLKVRFEDFTDFRGAQFNCLVDFRNVSFAFTTEFIDTSFDIIRLFGSVPRGCRQFH